MKFMMIVKCKEGLGIPPVEMMEAVEKWAADSAKSGVMLGRGGLKPSEAGARVVLANGKISVIDGPFAEAKEIIGGYSQVEMPSKEAAVQSVVQFMEISKKYWPAWEGETEIREMYGME